MKYSRSEFRPTRKVNDKKLKTMARVISVEANTMIELDLHINKELEKHDDCYLLDIKILNVRYYLYFPNDVKELQHKFMATIIYREFEK